MDNTQAANDLEDLTIVAKQIVLFLRKTDDRAKAHALVYVLRTQMEKIVSNLGGETPSAANFRWAEDMLKDLTEF